MAILEKTILINANKNVLYNFIYERSQGSILITHINVAYLKKH